MTVASRPPRSRPAKLTKPMPHGGLERTPRAAVSKTSAQRFAARVRARRRRRRLIILAVLLLFAGGAWAALKSPWATVSRIQVSGTNRIPPAQVRQQALAELGRPLLLARTADVAARIRDQRLVRSVRVQRHWPSTLTIQVLERVPVAAVPSGSGFALLDIDGVLIEQVVRPSAQLPRIDVALAAAKAGALRGCLDVLHGLPPNLKQQLASIGADSPDGIWLKLADGARVDWGNSAQSERKAQVLTALLPQHAVDYDVRSPNTPAVRGK